MSELKTSPELLAAIERAKLHVMTPQEIHEQRRSFVRGMCPSDRDYGEWCKLVDQQIPPLATPADTSASVVDALTAARDYIGDDANPKSMRVLHKIAAALTSQGKADGGRDPFVVAAIAEDAKWPDPILASAQAPSIADEIKSRFERARAARDAMREVGGYGAGHALGYYDALGEILEFLGDDTPSSMPSADRPGTQTGPYNPEDWGDPSAERAR